MLPSLAHIATIDVVTWIYKNQSNSLIYKYLEIPNWNIHYILRKNESQFST